jgi:hypothetical protein
MKSLVICVLLLFSSNSFSASVRFVIPIEGLFTHYKAFSEKDVIVDAYLIRHFEGSWLCKNPEKPHENALPLVCSKETKFIDSSGKLTSISYFNQKRVLAKGFYSIGDYPTSRGTLHGPHLFLTEMRDYK